MPSRIAASFSMQTISEPLIGVRDSGVALVTAAVWLMAFAVGTVTEKTEPPPAIGVERDAVVEDAREPLDDRQAKAKTARDPRALLEAVKLLEDLAALDDRECRRRYRRRRSAAIGRGAGSRPARGRAGYI